MKIKLSYELIEKAILDDEDAINRILKIYEPYINTLTSQTLFDQAGNEYIGVNVDLKEYFTGKLMRVISMYIII